MARDGPEGAEESVPESVPARKSRVRSATVGSTCLSPRALQTWPRHPCHQWGLKTTGCARVPDGVVTSRTRLGMLWCMTYWSDVSCQRKTSCRVKSRSVRVSSVAASPMS
jgi:hypothetical protein